MGFDSNIRNSLARMTSEARVLLEKEFTAQLQEIYGIQPDGAVAPLEKFAHLDDEQRETAGIIRGRVEHLAGSELSGKKALAAAVERTIREQAFTVLNRFAALRMCEERGLVQQCVKGGFQSKGFQIYAKVAGTGLGGQYERYRTFVNCLFDEIATDLGVLFDRFSAMGLLFPRESALEALLKILNRDELKHVWAEDETIGWIYQYFNPAEERKAMRKASSAPRNSRELAVRNQFFTPRYVVEFLTDNTLGRIWLEMRKGETVLAETCRYMVKRPNEIFLDPGEKIPEEETGDEELSREELLKKPFFVEHRSKKDPRDLKILDPACGSGHFLLYAFDLLEKIYDEGWNDEDSPPSEATGRTIREDFESIGELRRNVPELIVRWNLHGIDIDHRARQIAALSLWLRAQRSWREMGLKPDQRPRIGKSNIVCAEPMPGDKTALREFVSDLRPKVLGQLVEVIFEKMELAGDAGALLKIEEEIKDAVEEARKQWIKKPKQEQRELFPGFGPKRATQLEFQFDVAGITGKEFWGQAEGRIREQLKAYSEQFGNGNAKKRKLFAEDAESGFAFIDLCGKKFDSVVMNPPFGEFSNNYKAKAGKDFKYGYNDILAAFVERFMETLELAGRLGAITSRTCFFLKSFAEWRSGVVLKNSFVAMADLGQGVMDDAMVEAAAYVMQRGQCRAPSTIVRAIAEPNRKMVLDEVISSIKIGNVEDRLFAINQNIFKHIEGSPFVYWVQAETIRKVFENESFEPNAANVRQGLATGDDPRFVRAVWETPPENSIFCYYPSDGEIFCSFDDPIIQAFYRRRSKGEPSYAFHVKAGASQPWFSPITLKVRWAKDGKELKNFYNEKGKLRSRPQNLSFFFRPGFSWTLRAVRMYPYAIPSSCIPSVSRYMAFPKKNLEYETLGFASSRLASAMMRFYGEKFVWPKFLVENLKNIPYPKLDTSTSVYLRSLISKFVNNRRSAYQNYEPFQEFIAPNKVFSSPENGGRLEFDKFCLLDEKSENLIAESFGLSQSEVENLERDLREAIAFQSGEKVDFDDEEKEEGADFFLDNSEKAQNESLVSYLVGCVFGRWDIRFAIDNSLAPEMAGPFDPLPVCPPGTLVGPDGLPAEPGGIVSEEWFRARPNAIALPPEGTVKTSTIPDESYPVPMNWGGILTGETKADEEAYHGNHIVYRLRKALEAVWNKEAENVEQEICSTLGIANLDSYFGRPTGFFADHLSKYSKSRRKAPIYWPLSTESGSYTLWIYYHRLTDQTLFSCLKDFVNPKIEDVESDIGILQKELEEAGDGKKREKLESLQDFRRELIDFRDEISRVAKLPYKPNLNDGVLITASPLWRLFRHRQWRNDLKACREKLEAGEYDWAHMAHSIWPERVERKCRKDLSIAIAHDLENLYHG